MDIIEINIKTNAVQAAEQTKSLREQVRDLRKEMEQTAVGTESYEQAIKKLADATHEYRDQQDIIKNSAGDLGTAFANLQSVASNVVAGFSAVNAATQLLGANNEDLQKSMLKLQQGMALVQGLKGLEGIGKNAKNLMTSFKALIVTTKAQAVANTTLATSEKGVATATNIASVALKGFKAALASTGIGLIVIAAAALVTNLDKIGKLLGINKDATNEYAGANDRLKESFSKQNEELDLNVRLMEANGATALEVIQYKKKEAEAQLAVVDATMAEFKNKVLLERQNAKSNAQIKQFNKNLEEYKKSWEALQETRKELAETVKNLSNDETVQIVKDKNTQKRATEDAAKKAAEATKKAAEDSKKSAESLKKSFDKVLDDILKKYRTTIQAIRGVQSNLLDNQSVDDIRLFRTIYGINPKTVNIKLKGIQKSIVKQAILDLREERDKELEGLTDQNAINAINESYKDAINDLKNLIGDNDFIKTFNSSITDSISVQAKNISDTYINAFNNLNELRNKGIIDEQEYYSLLNQARTNYYKAGEELMNSDFVKTKLTEEDKARLIYELQVKPLETQQAINDAFTKEREEQAQRDLDILDRELTEVDLKYTNAMKALLLKQNQWSKESSFKGFWSTLFGTKDIKHEQELLTSQHAAFQQYNTEMVNNLTERFNAGLISQEEYNLSMADLENERLAEETNYTNQSKALKEDLANTVLNTSATMLNSFAQLTDSLNSLSEAQLSEYDRQLEAGEITQEKYDKFKKEALKKQASLQIATTIMQTGAGIATAWAQAMQLGPIAGPIVAGVETAALIANMAAQIVSIKTALASGLSGSTGSNSTPDTSMTLQSTDAYVNQVSDDTTADLQKNAQKNTKVYVTSTDISNQQDKDKISVTTSTF